MNGTRPIMRRPPAATELYWEMLEALGGSREDGPPLQTDERFAAAMGGWRDSRTGAPRKLEEHEYEPLIRRILAAHLAERPEMASHVRRRSCRRLQVRFPRSLYAELTAAAAADGTSLNTFVVVACAAAAARRARINTAPARSTLAPPLSEPVDENTIERLMRT